MAPRKSDGEGKGKKTTAVTTLTRQTRPMDRKTRSQTQRNSPGGGSSSSSSKLMTFESPEKRKRKSKAKEAGPATKKIKQEKEDDEEEPAVEEEEGDNDSEHCKIGVESSRNLDAVTEDRISELPEALLLHILSLVPTKDVIATSVLSKRWRSVWKMVPKLEFVCEIDHVSAEDAYRSLILHKAPVLESLHLLIEDKQGGFDISILIGTAFSRHVRELVLLLFREDQKTIKFPSYNNTLEVLKLEGHVLLDFPSRVCFSALRELHLERVKFKDEASVCNLLSGCPRLQDLSVERRNNLDVETYTIDVPSLQRLTIQDYTNWADINCGYVINAPSLKCLNILSLGFIDFCLIENAPELVEANILGIPQIENDNILASLTSAKRLYFDLPVEIKYPTGSIFYQLVSLEVRIKGRNWWNLLLFMLVSSPKLQSLKLDSFGREVYPVVCERNQPKCVPECMLLHLETLVWIGYGWKHKDEKQVATYILKNARQLKKATFTPTYMYTPPYMFTPTYIKQKEREERLEMLNELASVVRASKSCHLSVLTRFYL